MKSLLAFLSLFVLGQTKPFLPEIVETKVHEANDYMDNLLANIRTDPFMSMLDPLHLPFHRQDVIGQESGKDGTHLWILSNGTATGLSTLHRHQNCLVTLKDGHRIIRATVVTNRIQVVASLRAELSNNEQTVGKVYSSIRSLGITLVVEVTPSGQARLDSYRIESVIYLEPENFVGEFSPNLEAILHDAMYFGFSTKYGFDIGKVAANDLKDIVESAVLNLKYPISG